MIHSQMYLAVGRWDFLFVGAIVMVSLRSGEVLLRRSVRADEKPKEEVRSLRLCICYCTSVPEVSLHAIRQLPGK